MPGQVIGTVNVQVGNQRGTVRNISYGAKTLKSLTDVSMTGAQNGDVVVYNQSTNSFVVEPASSVVPSLDAGEF